MVSTYVQLTRETKGLDDGVVYSVTMQAHNACGWNSACHPCLMRTDDAEPQPPISLSAQPLSHSCINLSWLPWNHSKKFTKHELVVQVPHVQGGGGCVIPSSHIFL
jgi:hypothetical protein